MTTHTQGPWSVDDNHGKRYIEPIYSNEPIAEICKKKGGEYMANARLIAAAPDMLSALEGSITALNIVYPNGSPVLNAVIYAIAKARGQS